MKIWMNWVFVVSLVLTGCSSTTIVRSTDNNAKIYIDGEYKGTGSVVHSDQKIVGSVTHVELKKDGCRPISYNFSRNEEFSLGACIGGVLVLVPFLWIQQYKPDHVYDFKCEKM